MNKNFWKNKKILITGHTGFKGSWLSLWLQKLNAKLIGFSDNIPTKPSLYDLANIENKMTSVFADIRNFDQIEKTIHEEQPQIIFHMAAQSLVRKSYTNPLETYDTNVMGTANLLEAARKSKHVRVIINVTSDKCYENNGQLKNFKEDDPMGGFDPYSSSKACSELITTSFRNSFFNSLNNKNKTLLASVRAGNVIGGGDWAPERLIPDIMKGIMTDTVIKIRHPAAVRPWQHVLDPLNGYMILAENMWTSGSSFAEAWNFGPNTSDAKPVSWIVKLFQQHFKNAKFEIANHEQFHEAESLRLDCTKAQTRLDWKPKLDLNNSIRFIIDWYDIYQKNGNLRNISEKQIDDFMSM